MGVLACGGAWRNGSGAAEVVGGEREVGVRWARSSGVGSMRCGRARFGCVLFFFLFASTRWLPRAAAPAPASVASCRRHLPWQGVTNGRRHLPRRGARVAQERHVHHGWSGRRRAQPLCRRGKGCGSPPLPHPPPPLQRQCTSTAPPPTPASKRCPPLLELTSPRAPPTSSNHAAPPPPPPNPAHPYHKAGRGPLARPAIPLRATATTAAAPAAGRQARPPGHPRAPAAAGHGRYRKSPTCHPRWRRRSARRPRPS